MTSSLIAYAIIRDPLHNIECLTTLTYTKYLTPSVIVADEFRDGNSLPSGLTRWVPASSGNRRVVEKALAALPGGIAKIYLRGDSALYEHELMRWLDDKAIGYAISADMSPQLSQCIAALPEDHWKLDREETDAMRQWAEVNDLPSDGIWKKERSRRAAISPSASALARASCCVTATGSAISALSPTAPTRKAVVASI